MIQVVLLLMHLTVVLMQTFMLLLLLLSCAALQSLEHPAEVLHCAREGKRFCHNVRA